MIGSGAASVAHSRLDEVGVRLLNVRQTRHYDRWLMGRDEPLVSSLTAPSS